MKFLIAINEPFVALLPLYKKIYTRFSQHANPTATATIATVMAAPIDSLVRRTVCTGNDFSVPSVSV